MLTRVHSRRDRDDESARMNGKRLARHNRVAVRKGADDECVVHVDGDVGAVPAVAWVDGFDSALLESKRK